MDLIARVEESRTKIVELENQHTKVMGYLCEGEGVVSEEFYGKVYKIMVFTRKMEDLYLESHKGKSIAAKSANDFIANLRKTMQKK